jgi:hypothetical protein
LLPAEGVPLIRAALGLALAVALVPWLQRRVDDGLGGSGGQHEALYFMNGAQVKRVVPGFEQLAADLYWIRTVQYFGGKRIFDADTRRELLYPLIEITTTLDPRMEIAYRYGAVFLAEAQPIGAGRPDLGIAVLERGVRNNPSSWRLHQELGFFHFVYRGDARKAADVLVEASRIPGAGDVLKNLAAELLAKGGHRDTARRMWQEMYDQAEPGWLKNNARVHIDVLDAASAVDALNRTVDVFRQRTGRLPSKLDELAAARLARGPFVDPSGVPFDYDARTGRVNVSRMKSTLYREELIGDER